MTSALTKQRSGKRATPSASANAESSRGVPCTVSCRPADVLDAELACGSSADSSPSRSTWTPSARQLSTDGAGSRRCRRRTASARRRASAQLSVEVEVRVDLAVEREARAGVGGGRGAHASTALRVGEQLSRSPPRAPAGRPGSTSTPVSSVSCSGMPPTRARDDRHAARERLQHGQRVVVGLRRVDVEVRGAEPLGDLLREPKRLRAQRHAADPLLRGRLRRARRRAAAGRESSSRAAAQRFEVLVRVRARALRGEHERRARHRASCASLRGEERRGRSPFGITRAEAIAGASIERSARSSSHATGVTTCELRVRRRAPPCAPVPAVPSTAQRGVRVEMRARSAPASASARSRACTRSGRCSSHSSCMRHDGRLSRRRARAAPAGRSSRRGGCGDEGRRAGAAAARARGARPESESPRGREAMSSSDARIAERPRAPRAPAPPICDHAVLARPRQPDGERRRRCPRSRYAAVQRERDGLGAAADVGRVDLEDGASSRASVRRELRAQPRRTARGAAARLRMRPRARRASVRRGGAPSTAAAASSSAAASASRPTRVSVAAQCTASDDDRLVELLPRHAEPLEHGLVEPLDAGQRIRLAAPPRDRRRPHAEEAERLPLERGHGELPRMEPVADRPARRARPRRGAPRSAARGRSPRTGRAGSRRAPGTRRCASHRRVRELVADEEVELLAGRAHGRSRAPSRRRARCRRRAAPPPGARRGTPTWRSSRSGASRRRRPCARSAAPAPARSRR